MAANLILATSLIVVANSVNGCRFDCVSKPDCGGKLINTSKLDSGSSKLDSQQIQFMAANFKNYGCGLDYACRYHLAANMIRAACVFNCNPSPALWQNDRDLLHATVVIQGWNRWQNTSQHRKLTLENKILPLLLQGLKPTTFQSEVRCSNHWAIPAPTGAHPHFDRGSLSWGLALHLPLGFLSSTSTAMCSGRHRLL